MDGFSYRRGSVVHLQTFLPPCLSPSKQWDHWEFNAATIPWLLSGKPGHWAPCKNNVKMLLSNEAGCGYPSRHAGLLPTRAAPRWLRMGSPPSDTHRTLLFTGISICKPANDRFLPRRLWLGSQGQWRQYVHWAIRGVTSIKCLRAFAIEILQIGEEMTSDRIKHPKLTAAWDFSHKANRRLSPRAWLHREPRLRDGPTKQWVLQLQPLVEPCYFWPFASSACYPPLVQRCWFPLGSTTAPCMTLLHVWKISGVSAGLALHHANVPVLHLGGSRQRRTVADSSFLQQVNQVSASKDLPVVNPNFSAGAGTFPEAASTNCSPNLLFR